MNDFIHQNLRSSAEDWYIPLQARSRNQTKHTILSMPKAIDSVTVQHEGVLEKYHLMLISRRNGPIPDSINHYVLLLELLPNGAVIKKEDFPVKTEESECYISIDDFDIYAKGVITNNVFLKTNENSLLRFIWSDPKDQPKWEWIN